MKEFWNLLLHFRMKALFVEHTDNGFIQFFRSVFVGGIATLFDFGMAAVVRELIFSQETGWNNVLSNSAGFLVGLAVNFALSCFFVFSKSKYGRGFEFLVFGAIGLVGLCINNGIVALLGLCGLGVGWLFYLSKVVATLITLIWNFSARKFLLYRTKNLADQKGDETTR